MQYLIKLIGVMSLLKSPFFKRLQIGQQNCNNIAISILKSIDTEHFLMHKPHSSIDEHSEVTIEGIVMIIEDCLSKGCNYIQVDTFTEIILYQKLGKDWKIKRHAISSESEISRPFEDRSIKETEELKRLLMELGIITEQGTIRQKQQNKLEQIRQFTEVLMDVLIEEKLLNFPLLTIWDAACGKSYLSFLLYYHLHSRLKVNVQFAGIDINSRLIERCNHIRSTMGYNGMSFKVEKIQNLLESTNPVMIDILYSLHGCNTATDEAISLGIKQGAKLIIIAPCCQMEIKEQMKGDPSHLLRGITKYPFLKERLADVITDSIRSLVLEIAGYHVKVLRFVNSEITPKNLMIIASKVKNKNILQSLKEYKQIKEFFHLTPLLEEIIHDIFDSKINKA